MFKCFFFFFNFLILEVKTAISQHALYNIHDLTGGWAQDGVIVTTWILSNCELDLGINCSEPQLLVSKCKVGRNQLRSFMIFISSSEVTLFLLLLSKNNLISIAQNILLIPVLFSAQGLSTLRILPSFTFIASIVITLSTFLWAQNTLTIYSHSVTLIEQGKCSAKLHPNLSVFTLVQSHGEFPVAQLN